MPIHFTRHAQEKFSILKRHHYIVTKEQVAAALQNPEVIDDTRSPLLIAQKSIDDQHVLRVVYKHEGNLKIIITFYPGRKSQYAKTS